LLSGQEQYACLVRNYREALLMPDDVTARPVFGTEDADLPSTCSARGCGQPATWALRWNNPKIHTADRRKTWLACDEHKDSLSDFLQRRSFLREVEPFTG
jgi:hypothetical protein